MASRQVWQRSILDAEGRALTGVQVSVFMQDGITLATIFDGLSGGVKGNPFNTGLQAVARFYAAPGWYVVRAFKSGEGTQEWVDVDLSGKAVRTDAGGALPFNALSLSGLASAPRDPAVRVYIRQFYDGATGGGRECRWDPAASKSAHNGGTIIAPEALALFDGTPDTLSDFLSWTGAGLGCYVSVGVIGTSSPELSPREFGALPDIDNFLPISKMMTVKGPEYVFDTLFKTSPLTIDGANNGAVLRGTMAPNDVAGRTAQAGLAHFAAGQSFVLQLGRDSSTLQGGALYNFCVYGDDKTVGGAAVVFRRWSQAYSENLVIRNFKGLGADVVKLEDAQFHNPRVIKTGTVAGGEGGMRFSKSPDLASNIIRVYGGRFEWIDGPHVYLSDEADAAVSHVWFYGTKFEVAERDGYGSTRSSNPVFRFKPNVFWRCQNINLVDIWVAQAQRALCVFDLGHCDSFTATGFTMSTVTDAPITLCKSDGAFDMRSLRIKDYKVINTSGDFEFFKLLTDITSTCPVDIDFPTVYNGDGFNIGNNLGRNLLGPFECGLPSRLSRDIGGMFPSKQVMRVSGSNGNAICNLSSLRYPDAAQGYHPDNFTQLATVKFRAKAAAGALCRVELRVGGVYLDRQDISGDWQWYELGGSLRGRSGNLQVVNSSSSSADADILVDAVAVEFGKSHRLTSFADLSGTYESGDEVTLKRATSGPFKKVCTVGGNPATFVNVITI